MKNNFSRALGALLLAAAVAPLPAAAQVREAAELRGQLESAHSGAKARLEQSRRANAKLLADPRLAAKHAAAVRELDESKATLSRAIDAVGFEPDAAKASLRLQAIRSTMLGAPPVAERTPAAREPKRFVSEAKSAAGPKSFPAPTAPDLAATLDAPITPEIQALAESLNRNPVAIFNWVRANIGFVPTVGSVQGAAGTLASRSGNATDTASLLVALLRASNIPARYVTGRVEVEVSRLRTWLSGVATTQAALDLLTQGGIAHELVTNAGTIIAVRLDHVWTHAFIDAVVSRGAVNRQGDFWVELDAAYKSYRVTDGRDLTAYAQLTDPTGVASTISSAATINAAQGTISFLDAAAVQGQLTAAQQRIETALTANGLANAALGELIGSRAVDAPAWSLLPLSLPAKAISQSAPAAELAAASRHKISLKLYRTDLDRVQNATPLIAYEAPSAEIQGQTLSLRYVPATAADADTLVAALPASIPNAASLPKDVPGYLIDVRAELWLGDAKVRESPVITRMGEALPAVLRHQGLDADVDEQVFASVAGETRVLAWDLAGGVASRFEALGTRLRATQSAASPSAGALAVDPLAALALGYFATHDLYATVSAGVNHVRTDRLPSLASAYTWLESELNLGVPSKVHFSGIAISEASHQSLAAPAKPAGNVARYRWQSLNLASTLAHVLPEYAGARDGVSAVRVLAAALANQSPVVSATAATATRLNGIGLEADLKGRLDAAVNAGKRVSVNAADIVLPDWTGRAAIIEESTSRDGASAIRGGTKQVQYALGGNRADLGVGLAWAALLPDSARPRLAALHGELTSPVINLSDTIRAIAANPLGQRASAQTLAVISGLVLDRAAGPRVDPLIDSHLWSGLLLPHVRVNLLSESQAPTVTLTLTPETLAIGASTTVQVTAGDNVAVTQLTVTADGAPVTLSNGQATYTAPRAGVIPFVATARDAAGNFAEARRNLTVTDAGDTAPPTVAIASPLDGNELQGLTPVIGSASDASFRDYRVLISPADANQWTQIGSGIAPTLNAQLAVFDPSTLANGIYDIQLVARDTNGAETSVKISVIVKGELKIGQFALTFRDLEVEASGIPITVHRTYDTRRKGEALDFGFGWSVDYQDVKIQSNGVAGQGWRLEERGSGLSRVFCPVPIGAKIVTVRLPDGKMERFDAVVNPDCKTPTELSVNPDFVPGFAPRTGTASTLAVAGVVLRVAGNTLIDVGSGDIYNPIAFQLTTENKFVYILDKAFGIRNVSDPDGNTLTFSQAGISHSGGKSVAFSRDAAGRIAAIADPNGKVISYSYGPTGDLTAVTDRENLIASHTYNSTHGLTGYTDPRGTLLMRTEYDESGRVVKQTDAAGNAIDFTRDLANRTETVKDRRGGTTRYSYDAQGNVTTVLDAAGGTTGYTYDANGYEKSKTDANGHTVERTYDIFGKVLQEKDALGNPTDFTYDGSGNLKTLKDQLGRITESTYNTSNGALTSLKDAAGKVTSFGYSTTGNLTSITDAAGKTTTYEYDTAGNRVKETDSTGAVTTFTYDALGRELSRTQTRVPAPGQPAVSFTTTRVLDANGRVIRETDPFGAITRTEYNGLGKPTKAIDPQNRETVYEYDVRGNLTRTTFPDGNSETIGYDGEGNEVSRTDTRGLTTGSQYDALNRLTRVNNPDGSSVLNEYDPGGRLVATTDENNRRSTHEYDAAGRRTATVDAQNRRTEFTYDKVGNLLTVKDALNQITTHEYDTLNRRKKTTFADGRFVEFGYDNLGRKVSEKDAELRTTTFTYDNVGRLATVTDANTNPAPGVTTYGYDAAGNKITQTDALNRVTRWEYDHLGRVTKRTLPGPITVGGLQVTPSETFTYDASGNRTSHTSFKGQTISFEYDAQNRLIWKRLPGGAVVGFTYTATGQVASITDARGVTTHNYDARDRLARVGNPDGSVLEYGYDGAGNRTSLKVSVDGVSRTTGYGFDEVNRLASLTDPEGRTTTWTYDAAGNRKTQTLPNGIVTTWGYDNRNRLTSIEHRKAGTTLVASYVYTLSFTGQRTKVAETTAAGTRTVDYTYDTLYRLTSEKVTVGAAVTTTTYAYDKVGNRTSRTGGPTDYFYDAADRLTFEQGQTFTFDANGNSLTRPVTGGTATYEYDVENRLTKVTLPGTQGIVEYAYDAEGNRVETKVTQGGNTTITKHLVDKNRPYAEVVEERDGAGQLVATYTHGHDLEGPVNQSRYAGATATPSFYLTDALGSTRFLADTTGAATDSYLYDAFGNDAGRTGTTPNSYRFTGEQFDDITKLTYLRARWLNNNTGRFMTVDPHPGRMREPLTLNDYVYASANPVVLLDPTGLETLGGIQTAQTGTLNGISMGGAQVTRGVIAASNRAAANALDDVLINLVQREIPGVVARQQVFVTGPGGPRFVDLVFQLGQRMVAVEAKAGLFPSAGSALTRLAGQLKTFTAPTRGLPPGTPVLVFGETEATLAQLARLSTKLGSGVGTNSFHILSSQVELVQILRLVFLP